MSDRKLALLALKISDRYHLVWGLLCLIAGILIFGLKPIAELAFLAMFGLLVSVLIYKFSDYFSGYMPQGVVVNFIGLGAIFILAGILVAAAEYFRHTHPVLSQPENTRLQAVIEDISLRPTGRLRLQLKVLDSPSSVIGQGSRIRVTTEPLHPFQAGDRIEADARLFPLSLPAFYGRPDYARQHYFSGLSASGFITRLHRHDTGFENSLSARLTNWRRSFARDLNGFMPSPLGGIAGALLVGVRDFIPPESYESFRKSGLAHLLAISGLHMGLFCFSVYGAMRFGFAFFPSVSQRFSAHKLAAIAAWIAGGIYLCLSGFPVSAIRAYLMACIVIAAVLSDRRALTVRNLALVGGVMLLFTPSLVYSAGFQLSFMASFAIIYTLGLVRDMQIKHRPIRWGVFMFLSSGMAAIITLPVIAYHFAHFTLWGVMANLVAIPLTSIVILPSGIMVLLAGFTGFQPVLQVTAEIMAMPLGWLTAFANLMAGLPYAGSYLAPPPVFLLFFFSIAAVMLASLSGIWRGAGAGIAGLSAIIWIMTPMPDGVFLMANQQAVMVVRSENGHLVTTGKLSDFWQSHVAIMLGKGRLESADCPDSSYCIFPLASLLEGQHQTRSQMLAFARYRRALSHLCGAGFDYIISAEKPLYPCRDGQKIHYMNGKNNIRYLFYFQINNVLSLSNMSKVEYRWHPHF